jgi:MOSC domain-containing protein YiiM
MGNVIGIATREKTGAPMMVSSFAKISFEKGVGEDSRGLIKGNRQVTVMTQESWRNVCCELDCDIKWTTRRANLLIEGIDLENTKGDILNIGNFMLEITGELVPCNRMDEQLQGLTKALAPNWRGGVTCKVLSQGDVKEGDKVTLSERS